MMLLISVALLVQLVLAHNDCPSYSFGSCSDPSIIFGFNLSSSGRWGYQPSNNDFEHGWSPDIATIESFICNRLQSPCSAPSDTVATCNDAFNDLSGLSGENAVHAWNAALRLNDDYDHDDCTNPSIPIPEYATTVTATIYSVEPSTVLATTLTTLTTSTTYTSTFTERLSTTYSNHLPSSTLTITLTLPTPTTTTAVSATSTSTQTTTHVFSAVSTTSVTATAAGSGTTQAVQSDGGNGGSGNPGDDGGGSPFDSSAGQAATSFSLCMPTVLCVMAYIVFWR